MRWRATVAVAGVLSATVAAVGECALKRLDTIANKSSAITNYIFTFLHTTNQSGNAGQMPMPMQ